MCDAVLCVVAITHADVACVGAVGFVDSVVLFEEKMCFNIQSPYLWLLVDLNLSCVGLLTEPGFDDIV